MKHSIKRQFALIFIGVMAGVILLCLSINHLFLEQYYIRSKTTVIYDAYHVISEAANSDVYGGEDEYLEMYGRLSSGIYFIMRTPVESIRESAKIANRFYAYVGIAGALAGGILVWFASGKLTRPILELNRISEQMVHLDFEAKYQGNAHNEIGLLGENINKHFGVKDS